jgi:glutamate racemase
MNNHPIGILDSGVGGLTVWKEITELLPHESTVYIGDSINTPYGQYHSDTIHTLAQKLVAFLLGKNAKIIVIACNTITVTCLEKLREEYPNIPIIGTVPVVKTAAEVTKNKKIGILSTTNTAKSIYQKNLIEKFANNCEVHVHGTEELVPLIENGKFGEEKMREVLLKTLSKFIQEGVDTVALGCTHFPFVKAEMQEIMGNNVRFLDSGAAIARQVKRVLEHRNALCGAEQVSKYEFFTTGDTGQFKIVAKRLGKGTITESIAKIRI